MSIRYPTRQRILDLVRTGGGLTMTDLSRQTELSRANLRRHVAALKRAGLVNCEVVHRTTGRPSCVYRVVPGSAVHERYAEFLHFLHGVMQNSGGAEIEDRFREIAKQMASLHPEVRTIVNPALRLEVARRIVFGMAAVGRDDLRWCYLPVLPPRLPAGTGRAGVQGAVRARPADPERAHRRGRDAVRMDHPRRSAVHI